MRNITPNRTNIALVRSSELGYDTIKTAFSLFLRNESEKNMRNAKKIAQEGGLSESVVRDVMRGDRLPSKHELGQLVRAMPSLRRKADLLAQVKQISDEREEDAKAAKIRDSYDTIEVELVQTPPMSRPQPIPQRPKVIDVDDLLHKSEEVRKTAYEKSAINQTQPEPPPMTPPKLPPVALPQPQPKPSISPRTFGEWLRACREGENLKKEDVADMIGVVPSSVHFWEEDQAVPVRENYDKLVEIFSLLKGAPKPKVRDIPVPRGATGHGPRGSGAGTPSSSPAEPAAVAHAALEALAAAPPSATPAEVAQAVVAAIEAVPATPDETDETRLSHGPTRLGSSGPSGPLAPAKAMIKFGRELEKLKTLDLETRKRVGDVVRLGFSAGLAIEDVLAMLIEKDEV